MATLQEIERLRRDEESIQGRRFQFARESTEARENRQLAKRIKVDLAAAINQVPGVLPTILSLSPHEQRTYSVSKLVNALARESKELSLEREISQSIAQDLKQVPEHGGVYVPFRVSMSGLDTKTNAGGKFLTEERVSGEIVDYLRAQNQVLKLGAKLLTGVGYATRFASENSLHAATWVTENPGSDVAASDPVLGARVATPHALASTTSVSRQMLAQSTPNVEGWIRSRIAKAHAQALDIAAVNGSGLNNQPLGILKTPGISSVAIGTDGGAPTLAAILDMESKLGDANVDLASVAFLTTSKMRLKLRQLAELASGVLPLWSNNSMLGYVASCSANVPSTLTKGVNSDCHAIVLGDWAQLLLVEFGGVIEIVVDQYAQKRQGMVEISSWASYDVLVLQPAAFVAVSDARYV